MSTEHDWDALAEKAEAGALASLEGTALQGADAARDARETLMAVTGTDTIEEATKVALGRPPLDAERRENVTWKVRAPAQLDDLAADIARREGKTLSALIRDAVADYARAHA